MKKQLFTRMRILLLALCLQCFVGTFSYAQIITTIAGTGTYASTGDGGAATAASFRAIVDIAVDRRRNIYIAESDNNKIRRIDSSGVVTTFAGTGTSGFSGDGGAATAATLHSPFGVAVDSSGNVYISDGVNHRIRKVDTSGVITTIAGRGSTGGTGAFGGDGGAATAARLAYPASIAFDISGNLYIVDANNFRVRKINTSGIISTFAGNGSGGYSGDGGPATAAGLWGGTSLFVAGGNLYLCDVNTHRIRKVNSSRIISTIAGTGTSSYSGDGGAATAAYLNNPRGVVVDASGNVYISDQNNSRVRKIDTSGVITTLAGTGTSGHTGDGGPATAAQIEKPAGLAIDGNGDLLMGDTNDGVIRKISISGTSTTSGTLSGASSVCVSANTTLTSSGTSGGAWSSSSTSIATVSSSGVVTGVSAGSATISYSVSGASSVATMSMTVNPLPNAGTISGLSTLCTSTTTTLTSSGSGGGSWTSSSTARATVNASGVVTGVTAGAVTISYSVTNGCGTDVATNAMTINASPVAGTISGATNVCVAANTTLTTSGSGGSWSSSATGTATVNSSTGSVFGVAAGSATITYTATNSCGTSTATSAMTVNPLPNAGTISGASVLCTGATTTLTSSGTGGGSWTSSNAALASVDASTGDVTGVATGSVTITYSVTNGCGTSRATASLSMTDVPTVAAIGGPSSVCQYATITLTDATSGGTWSSVTPSVATVSPTGVVTGLIVTGTTIHYAVTNGCGTTTVDKIVTVNPLPAAPASITGSTTIGFTGGTTTLSSATTGGSWTSSNTAILTVNTSGVATSVASGTATITYTISNSCGSAYVTASVTCSSTNHAPMFMGGDVVTANVCANASAVALNEQLKFKDLDAGQTVTISVISGPAHGSVAVAYTTTSTGGIIIPAGLTFSPSITDLGMDSAYVRVTDGVAADTIKVRINVVANPTIPVLTGDAPLCTGSTLTLTAVPSGGFFGSMDGNSTTGSTSGIVRAVAGTSSVIYYNGPYSSAGCRTQTRVTIPIINNPAAATLTGSPTICPAAATTLSATIGGGTWSVATASIASVNTGGTVTGILAGTTTVSYTLTNTCGATTSTKAITVSGGTTSIGAISGSPYSCIGTPSTLTNATSGGSWSSTNTSIANVSSAGIVTPVAVGVDTIIYAYTNSCGTTTSVTRSYRVYPTGIPATITGPSTVVNGSAITLSSSPAAGTWASSNVAIATVAPSGAGGSTTGMVTGRSVGTAIISYTISTTCAMLTTTYTVSVTSSRMNNTAGGATEGDVTVSLFPNPTSGTVAVELSNAEGQTDAIVTDIAGKVIVTQTSATPKLNLDLSKLVAGTYFVKVKNAGNTFNEKIIVE